MQLLKQARIQLLPFSSLKSKYGLGLSFLISATLLIVPHAQAQNENDSSVSTLGLPVPLATISSDRNKGISLLSLILDQNSVVSGITFQTQDNDVNPPVVSQQNFSLADIQTASGALLLEQSGHKVLYLRGRIDSQVGTGALVVRYLSNGLWGSYEECRVNAVRSNDGVWHLQNAYSNQIVQEAKVITYSLGIRTIQNICPSKNFEFDFSSQADAI